MSLGFKTTAVAKAPPSLKKVKKIGLLRMLNVGELMFSLPLIQAIKEHAPQAELVYLGSDWHTQFIPRCIPQIDRVIEVWSDAYEMKDWADKEFKQLKHLSKESFDVLFSVHDNGQLGDRLVNVIKPKWSIGFSNDDKSPLNYRKYYERSQHKILAQLELLEAWGVRKVDLHSKLNVGKQDQEIARSLLNGHKDYVIIHPGGSDPRRFWPIEQFAKLSDWLSAKGLTVVVIGDRNETVLGTSLQMHAKSTVVNLTGQTSLSGTAGLIQNAKLAIGNDSGPLHMARAFGIPSVGLFAISSYGHFGSMFARQHRSLVSCMAKCPDCKEDIFSKSWPDLNTLEKTPSKDCLHNLSLVSDITYEDVQEAVASLI